MPPDTLGFPAVAPTETASAGATERAVAHVLVGEHPLTIEDVLELAHGRAQLALDPQSRRRIAASADYLADLVARNQPVYGVTTGVGDSVTTAVPTALARDLQLNLFRFHGCGVGPVLEPEAAAAVLAVRVASLARGHSGVRVAVVERLCELLNKRILPQIPALGSVGASGDLTPLSYVAALLVGEREAWVDGRVVAAQLAVQRLTEPHFALFEKESLSIMNGTSVMTALACLAFDRARRLCRWSAALTAVCSDVLQGNPAHFDARLFALKPHPGQARAAAWIAADIEREVPREVPLVRLQDRYSIRCAPHVIGVLVDALAWMRPWIETEINSCNDNPLLDPETDQVLHGGHFYGGHIGFAMDACKTAVASLCDLADRQMAQLCDPSMSNGLPANLVLVANGQAAAHHGFKAMAIATSALAAEACKLAMPATVFSRSTECHNQDKVPMATIAARDCLQALDLAEWAAAMVTLAAVQAVDLRQRVDCHVRARTLHAAVRAAIAPVTADRRMDQDIATVLQLHRSGALPVGQAEVT
ncbi:MAG: aromatic amino acid lyase [Deltaproteobacteria bacterium]|nr:aromatic amino acid lyase [Deltaproteobacteria bacterium]